MMNGGGSGAQPILPFNIADLPDDRGPPGLRKKDMALADTDPLGVARSVDFTAIGGLDEHIRALKEMVMLPLLYPELFTEKRIIPPRGVIFHGPPGTGKTLMARALANSCTTTNQPVAFFMRKGADCLSKWVGEAERHYVFYSSSQRMATKYYIL
ncbi:P-loop containing nucleoside triphosphate hydrolase protein [Syncephalis plumigaleata]|nr:P-loop containing nucleoside triphosphate hydrolase protein [Syncephalis plumigaleata]